MRTPGASQPTFANKHVPIILFKAETVLLQGLHAKPARAASPGFHSIRIRVVKEGHLGQGTGATGWPQDGQICKGESIRVDHLHNSPIYSNLPAVGSTSDSYSWAPQGASPVADSDLACKDSISRTVLDRPCVPGLFSQHTLRT